MTWTKAARPGRAGHCGHGEKPEGLVSCLQPESEDCRQSHHWRGQGQLQVAGAMALRQSCQPDSEHEPGEPLALAT